MRKQWCLFAAPIFVAAVFAVDQPVDARASDHKPALVELGRRLFMDPSMSREQKNACADCHQPEHGFSDPRVKSLAANGPTARHSQPILNLATSPGFHWDGEFDSLKQLAVARMGTPAEALDQARNLHNAHFAGSRERGRTPDEKEFRDRMRTLAPPYYGPTTRRTTTPVTTPLLLRLQQDSRYKKGFDRAFGPRSRVTTAHLAQAMEAYMLSIESTATPYDRFVQGKPDALSESARRGLYVFEGKARCSECHTVSKQGEYAAFTDGEYHNTGVAFRGIYGSFSGKVSVDGGRGTMSFVKDDLGMFKTPTLRDVSRRPPYMHDGGFKTLEEVVRYYDEGGTPNARLSRHVGPLDLTDKEVKDLVAFLDEGLTSYVRPGLGPIPAHRPDETVITLETLAGKPVKGIEVEVRPYGDRFQGEWHSKPMKLIADKRGRIKFTFPPTTHVILSARGFEIGLSRPIPDYVPAMTLRVTPMDQVMMRVWPSDKGPRLPAILHATVIKKGAVDGASFVRLKKLRSLKKDRSALYVAPAGGRALGVRTVVLEIRKKKGKSLRLGIFDVDFSGGQTEPIDLRNQLSFPTVPTFTPGTPGAPPLRGRTTPTGRGTR